MTDIPIAMMTCPKCHGTMRSYERNGVIIDQCQECRGVFLNRGELERLIDAEERSYAPSASSDRHPAGDGGHHGSDHGDSPSKRKRGGFLGDLFDS